MTITNATAQQKHNDLIILYFLKVINIQKNIKSKNNEWVQRGKAKKIWC